MMRAFICHSNVDEAYVVHLVDVLERYGYICWYYERDNKGNHIGKAVDEALLQSDCAIFVMTGRVTRVSDYVENEINYFIQEKKKIIPLRVSMPSNWYPIGSRSLIQAIPVIDDTDGSIGIGVVREIVRVLGGRSGGIAGVRNKPLYAPANYSANSSYASAWKLVPHLFKRNEGVAFPVQWDNMLDAFWKAWNVKSEEAIRQATALFLKADRHDPEIQYRIGAMLSRGWFGDNQRGKANEWFEAAAAKGNYMAMLEIGDCYRTGIGGCPQNQEISQMWYMKAFESIKQAASKGDGRAMYHAGCLCRFGYMGEERPKEGIAWWEKAVQTGNCEAQHWLSREYASGEFVAKNMNKAISLCVDSAVGGLGSAMTKMGRYCKEGVPGVMNASLKDALKWYQLAEEHGKPHSCKNQIDELLELIKNEAVL